MKRIAATISTTLTVLLMTGCFTGIESTPKITANDVKKERAVQTPEDSYLNNITYESLEAWQPGKLFYITDDKISLTLEPSATPAPKAGEYIAFDSYRPVTSLTGSIDTEIIFHKENGQEVVYKASASPDELQQRKRVEIPFTIETSVVDATKEVLAGKTFYIKTPIWYTATGDARNGLKFIPVTIEEITPGNMVYPVKLKFSVDSPYDDTAYVYMSVGDSSRSTRNFAALFSLTDPHLRYPAITDETWDRIIHGRVAPYMTREECRLSLGAPSSIDRRAAISSLQELWTYENGVYLIFDDGLLQSFRR